MKAIYKNYPTPKHNKKNLLNLLSKIAKIFHQIMNSNKIIKKFFFIHFFQMKKKFFFIIEKAPKKIFKLTSAKKSTLNNKHLNM